MRFIFWLSGNRLELIKLKSVDSSQQFTCIHDLMTFLFREYIKIDEIYINGNILRIYKYLKGCSNFFITMSLFRSFVHHQSCIKLLNLKAVVCNLYVNM